MMIVMKPTATEADVQHVIERIEACGARAHPSRGDEVTVIGAIGDREHVARLGVEGAPGVQQVVPILKPYKLASNQLRGGERTVIEIGGRLIGGDNFSLIAGPCTVESREQVLETAHAVKNAGGKLLRGGAFKPRTSPYAFQGLGVDGLKILAEVSAEVGLPAVTEVVDAAEVATVAEYADMLQIGTRNMQNFPLLQAVGGVRKPVMLKRGLTATYEEWLMAAEYVAQRGNLDIVLCERGIRTFETATRNTLDVSAVPMVHALSHLPVVVDPSHSAGKRDLVVPLTRAAIAVGADAVMVDVHADPTQALCDGPQALYGEELEELARACRELPPMIGRTVART